MHIAPTGAALGAFITGIDLARPLAPEGLAAFRAAIVAHKVVFLPDQHITLDDLERLTDQLGGRRDTPYVKGLADRPMVVRVLREADAAIGFGEAWHTDLSYLAAPPAFTLLWSSEIPPKGGDTMWSNQAAAYAALDDATKREIANLTAVHSAIGPYGAGGYYAQVQGKTSMQFAPSAEAHAEHRHPVVIRHPESGEKILFVNRTYALRIEGYDAERSARLLNALFLHAVSEPFRYRLQWRPHMLTIWDNRSTQHLAVNDYQGHRRDMYRTTAVGTALEAA
ncbi:MAG: TauD/TfdA family dioxygenase [Alphaproteobacteria bacterium]|nr:TauD/TfdA family dioxygenase [Alphaproteobacteria bacterium]